MLSRFVVNGMIEGSSSFSLFFMSFLIYALQCVSPQQNVEDETICVPATDASISMEGKSLLFRSIFHRADVDDKHVM